MSVRTCMSFLSLFVLQSLRAVGCQTVEAPERAEPPPTADVRYVSGTPYSMTTHCNGCVTLHV